MVTKKPPAKPARKGNPLLPPPKPGAKKKGGAMPGGGRPKGSKSKRTLYKATVEALLGKDRKDADGEKMGPVYGKTPLEFMIAVMNDRKMPTGFRAAAAKDAAPYVHPKLATVTIAGDPAKPLATHQMDTKEYQTIAKKIAKDI